MTTVQSETPLRRFQMLIDGHWVDAAGGGSMTTVNPYSGRDWAIAPDGTDADVDAAVSAARAALSGPWGKMTASERGRLIRRLGDLLAERAGELAQTESTDNGKLLREMSGQLNSLPSWYEYFGGLADKIEGTTPPPTKPTVFTYTRQEPVGVVGAILPWNSPLLLMTFKVAPALAAGCTLVVKPAEQTPISTLEFARLFEDAGFPPGVFNVVTGGREVGAALTGHRGVDKVAFTGSTQSGVQVMKSAADHLAKVGISVADMCAAVYALSAIVTSVLQREHTGVGTFIDISMLECLSEWMMAPAYHQLYSDTQLPRAGARHNMMVPYGVYPTGDGEHVNFAVQTAAQWSRLCEDVLERPDLIDDARFATKQRMRLFCLVSGLVAAVPMVRSRPRLCE